MPSRYLVDEIPARPWAGQRCFIIGGGKSLKGFNFEMLRGEKIIAINRACEDVPFAEIMFSLDSRLYGWYTRHNKKLDYGKFESFRGLRVWVETPGHSFGNDVLLVKMAGKQGLAMSLPDGIYTGGNSGYAAINLAVALGANPINLLGFDMDKKGNYHSGYPTPGGDPKTRGWIEGMNELAGKVTSAKIKIINLNPKSKLKCFPFGELKTKSTITAITPTGDRPLAFALCQQWMANQTVKPDQWLVIDDGKTPSKHFAPMQYVRRKPKADDPKHTLVANLKKALPLITGDKIIVWEDDEYYAPDYIERMAKELDSHEMVGIERSKYYHLASGGYRQFGNIQHASFAATAFRSSVLPEFVEIINGSDNPYVDMALWKKVGNRGYLFTDDKPLYLGIKGLPGRAGICNGHDAVFYHTKDTDERTILKKWIPKDYQVYLDILNNKLNGQNHKTYFKTITISDITGITVCWNTKDLIKTAYNSIRKLYPTMPIIIIDGSDESDPCAAYVRGLVSDITTVVSLGYNIGHGRGMCMGMKKAKTPYALMFDSDIELLEPCLPAMLAMMEADTFGVGYLENIGYDGFRYKVAGHPHPEGPLPCLHPYFQLINIKNYKKFHPYVHHGMPVYLTMLDIHKKGLSSKILKQFPGLVNSVHSIVKHHSSGTGGMRVARGLPHIEGPWVDNRGQV